ncbi:partitioning defective 3 homolog [Ceratina calcarata]|uniref:Partitioning defective 3 homolog n=1 Tax=Ceratina calcarata TaxID=156304 RepID=A0AAJ7ND59_9HYME|nr:partitioning defective 3 homolog [Ceratina calcarata]
MKVTVCFDNVRVVVPCGDGTLLVKDLMHEAILRYKKATGKNDNSLTINSLSSLTGGGLLDPDDRLCDVADDREQIVAHFVNNDAAHGGGDGASSVGTNSPDFFHPDSKEPSYGIDTHSSIPISSIKRESTKRLSMHALSTREPCLTAYSAQSLPRESRRREPLGQDAKVSFEYGNANFESGDQGEIRDIVIKSEAGPLGLHVVPCYDLLGNDQGLRVEGIEPNGRIARDGQIDLHDKIIKINGHNLLHIPFSKVQEIFRTCMTEPCLQISVVKHKRPHEKSLHKNHGNTSGGSEKEIDDNIKKLQCSNYNLLQTANTRKIGRMIEIELTKGSNGLGFSVTTRDNPAGGHCPIYIKNILPKGAAVEDGRLRPGDRLLEVNNKEMTGKSQAEVVSLLRSIPSGGKVRIVVSRQEEISSNIPESDSQVTSTSQPTEATDNAKYWNASNTSPLKKNIEIQDKINTHSYDKCAFKPVKSSTEDIVLSPRKNRMILTLDIPVHDSEKAGLGVSVKGKTTNTDENTNMDLGIFIKSVIHGGAASRDGRLRTNDQLLNVNGVSLLGLSNSDAMETLRRAMLNTNSSVTGVITLTIARRISSYDGNEKNLPENVPSLRKLESVNSIYISDSTKGSEGRIKEKNNINSQTDILDNGGLLSCVTASPWNPVIDRLTEQYNKNSLRNESYCIATNKTWIEPSSNVKKISIGQREDRAEPVLLEDSNESQHNEAKRNTDDKDSQYSGDPTYDSQLSLEEFNSSCNKFSRDALGRQSMSEKRHAALDAKNTDTYKRNKKLREGRENKNQEQPNKKSVNQSTDSEEQTRHKFSENYEKTKSKSTTEGSVVSDGSMKRNLGYEKSVDPTQSEYVYTIPGCNNKYTSPRKHWLVDDVHGEITSSNNFKDDREGFPNSRGDVKQASLNSALDDRYKRSRKKGGIRSMLRLGKNRKSLNFGDSIEARHESTFQLTPNQLLYQQKRYRGKINIRKPKIFFKKRVLNELLTPFFVNPNEGKTLEELCLNANVSKTEKELGPYDKIIAREARNWFDTSKMVACLHVNSMSGLDKFDVQVPLYRANMYYKYYNPYLVRYIIKDSPYEGLAPLVSDMTAFVFSPEINVTALQKIIKKCRKMYTLGGMLEGKVLKFDDFLRYGTMDITTAQSGLVQVLQSAGGVNLSQQLTHHQSTLVTRLKQIGTNEINPKDKQ